MSIETVALIMLALVAGALAKGATGLGLPLIAVPVMAGFIGVEHAVVVMVLPLLVTNAWMVVVHRRARVALPDMRLWLIVGALGAVFGTWLLSELDDRMLLAIMAAWLGLYLASVYSGRPIKLAGPLGDRLAPAFCFLAGTMQGANGMSGPLVSTFFHARRLEPSAYLLGSSAMYLVFQGVQSATLGGLGLLTGPRMIESALALIPAVIGLPLGVRLGRMLSPRTFNRLVIALLSVMELKLLYEAAG